MSILLATAVAGEAVGSTSFSEMSVGSTSFPEMGDASASFSAMGVGQVSTLLAKGEAATGGGAVSAKDTADDATAKPLTLTACDMVSKVYGIIDPSVCREECLSQTQQCLRLTPIEDENALWLETEGGFGVDYYGMTPEVSAMARYADSDAGASDYGFFFLFPYTSASHADCVRRQAEFCGTLLQEMADEGLPLDLNIATDDLFEAVGNYNGSQIDVRLLDDQSLPGEGTGRFILILAVEPGAL